LNRRTNGKRKTVILFYAFAKKFEQYSDVEDEEEENSPENDRPPTHQSNMRINRERAAKERPS